MNSIPPVNNFNSSNLVCTKRSIDDFSKESDSNDLVDSAKKLKLSPDKSSGVFEKIPLDVVKEIFKYLTPREAIVARQVCRFFAKWLGDDDLWRFFYQTVGLNPARMPIQPNLAPLPCLAKSFFRWTELQKVIEVQFRKADAYSFDRLQFAIGILVDSEFSPLHNFIMKRLKEYKDIPNKFTQDDLILSIAKKDLQFSILVLERIRVIESLNNRSGEPKIQEALIDLIDNAEEYADGHCIKGALKCLVPHMHIETVKAAVLKAIDKFNPNFVKPCLDVLISDPIILNKVVNKYKSQSHEGLSYIVRDNLNNNIVVSELIRILNQTDNSHLQFELMRALMPLAKQENIQHAICESLIRYNDSDKDLFLMIKEELFEHEIFDSVIAKHKCEILDFKEILEVISIKHLTYSPETLEILTESLKSSNKFLRITAAKILAPHVPESLKLQFIFIGHLEREATFEDPQSISTHCGFDEVYQIIVPALVKCLAKSEAMLEPLMSVIKANRISPRVKILAIEALQPYSSKPEIQSFFTETMMFYLCFFAEKEIATKVFANFIQYEPVKKNLLEILTRAGVDNKKEVCVALEVLAPFIESLSLKETILNIYEKNIWGSVKAACIRALCSNPKKMPLKKEDLLFKLHKVGVDDQEARLEARKALLAYVNA